MDLTRLRSLVRSEAARRAPARELTYVPDPDVTTAVAPSDHGGVAACLGGALERTPHGPCIVIDRVYDADAVHGDREIRACNPLLFREGFERLCRLGSRGQDPHAGGAIPASGSRILFLDLETTGLSGGAGTYAFLVGCAWFEGESLQVRQLLLPGFGAERALLELATELLGGAGGLVSYNGKTFDLPVLEMRFLFHRLEAAGRPHLDLLHPARRLWRGRGGADGLEEASCRLTALERALLDLRRTGDVPGFEIPARYFHYIRTADPAPLVPVLEHNRLDLVSLAALTAQASRLAQHGPGESVDPAECLGLAAMDLQLGAPDRALEGLERAVDLALRPPGCAPEITGRALRALARRLRSLRRYRDAAAVWSRLLAVRGIDEWVRMEAIEALAVHHEHRQRDLPLARRYATEALAVALSRTKQEAVSHRLARLDRKLAARPAAAGQGWLTAEGSSSEIL